MSWGRLAGLLALCLQAGAALAQPAGFVDQVTVGIRTGATAVSQTRFYLWYPAGVTPLKGILATSARGAGYNNGSGFQFGINPIIREAATRNGLAIIVHQDNGDAGIVTGFDPALDHGDSLLKAYSLLATRNNLPELENAPLIPFGHSLGTRYSVNMGYWNPDRVAATINYKMGDIAVPTWTSPLNPTGSVANIPYLFLNAELEGPDINNNAGGFYAQSMRGAVLARRASGALITQAIEMSGSHSTLTPKVARYLAHYIDKVVQYRIPATADPRLGPVALNPIAESSGWLGSSNQWNDFSLANYSTAAFAGGSPASSFWFFDEEDANTWRDFHVAGISYVINGGTQPFNCSSNLTVDYTVSPDSVLGADNVFYVEMSNLRGDFDGFSFPRKIIGSLRSSAMTGSIPVTIPDNLQYEISRQANTPKRYRWRVISTNRRMESATQGELNIDTCATQGLWVFKPELAPGQPNCPDSTPSFMIRVFKRPSLVADPGSVLTAELSDSTGSFASPVVIGTKADPLFISNRDTVMAAWPTGQATGLGYRVRVTLSSPALVSTTNGSDIMVACPQIINSARTTLASAPAIKLYPNPAAGNELVLELNKDNRYAIVNVQGQLMQQGSACRGKNTLNITHLRPGMYILHIDGAARLFTRQ